MSPGYAASQGRVTCWTSEAPAIRRQLPALPLSRLLPLPPSFPAILLRRAARLRVYVWMEVAVSLVTRLPGRAGGQGNPAAAHNLFG